MPSPASITWPREQLILSGSFGQNPPSGFRRLPATHSVNGFPGTLRGLRWRGDSSPFPRPRCLLDSHPGKGYQSASLPVRPCPLCSGPTRGWCHKSPPHACKSGGAQQAGELTQFLLRGEETGESAPVEGNAKPSRLRQGETLLLLEETPQVPPGRLCRLPPALPVAHGKHKK